MKHLYYILEDRKIKTVDAKKWSTWQEGRRIKGKDPARIAYDEVTDKVNVSTVFLSLDHNWGGEGDPILFETMVFGGRYDGYMRRYTTIEAAEEGHKEILEQVKQSEPHI